MSKFLHCNNINCGAWGWPPDWVESTPTIAAVCPRCKGIMGLVFRLDPIKDLALNQNDKVTITESTTLQD